MATIPTLVLSSNASLPQKISLTKTKVNEIVSWQNYLTSGSSSTLRLTDITTDITNLTNNVDSNVLNLTNSINTVGANLATNTTNLNNLITSTRSELTDSIILVSTNLTSSINTVNTNLTSSINTVNTNLDTTTTNLTNSINLAKTDLNNSISLTTSNLTDSINLVSTNLTSATTSLTNSISVVSTNLATTNTNLATTNTNLDTLSTNFTNNIQVFTTNIGNINTNISTTTSYLTGLINNVSNNLATTDTNVGNLTAWKNNFMASVQSDETLKNINDAIINTKNSIGLISEQLTSIATDSTYTFIEKIYDNQIYTNKVYNRASSFIILEGEVDDLGVLNFATGNGSYIFGRFGVIIPRKSVIKSISCTSNINGEQTVTTLTIPIINYKFTLGEQIDSDGNVTTNALYNLTLTKLINNTYDAMIPMTLNLANSYQFGGNRLSVGPITTDNNTVLNSFTRFRLIFEIAAMEDYLDSSNNVILYSPSIVPPDTNTNILPNAIDTTKLV
jgi:hypothetical protein